MSRKFSLETLENLKKTLMTIEELTGCPEEKAEDDVCYTYKGGFETLEEYARSAMEASGLFYELSESFRESLDFEKIGKELETSRAIITIELEGILHVFGNH